MPANSTGTGSGGGEPSHAAADTAISAEQWVKHHGVATAAHAKAMLGLQRRRRTTSRDGLQQLLKTEEVAWNHEAFTGVLTGGDPRMCIPAHGDLIRCIETVSRPPLNTYSHVSTRIHMHSP